MSWVIDNANLVYLVLGLVALGFAAAGWLTRRVKFLVIAGIPLLFIALFWLLTLMVVTDQQQIQANVNAMGEAVVRGDAAGLLKHVSRDFRHKGMTREQLAEIVKRTVATHKISEIKIREFELVELSRPNGSAKAHFKASVFDKESVLALVLCIGDFVREDDQWKLKAIDFRSAVNPDQPMQGAP